LAAFFRAGRREAFFGLRLAAFRADFFFEAFRAGRRTVFFAAFLAVFLALRLAAFFGPRLAAFLADFVGPFELALRAVFLGVAEPPEAVERAADGVGEVGAGSAGALGVEAGGYSIGRGSIQPDPDQPISI
jgi:hypothetical protein